MTTRLRILTATGVAVLAIVGGLIAYRVSTASPANDSTAQIVTTDAADTQVCSHVSPVPYLWAPGGDWKTPAVAAVASGASPLVRDAYFAAASIPFPESSNWSETFPPYERAMSQLATVCAGVRARVSP